METKHTKEYAEKLRLKYVDNFKTTTFEDGYMAAIKETSAPELLEALNCLINKFASAKEVKELGIENELNNAINAIKKATT